MYQNILMIIAAYLLGSLSSAIIVCLIMGLPDPRTAGSQNPGATNVLRIGGKKAAAITLLGDMLKGLLPVLGAQVVGTNPTVLALIGLAAFLGHLYPVWFKFQGGKGVATTLGVQIGLYWIFGGAVALLWFVMAKLTKISSLAALVSMTLSPIILWWLWPSVELLIMQLVMTAMLIWRHRSNIKNLYYGIEGQIDVSE